MTHRWLDRCIKRFNETEPKYGYNQSLFPIVQGCVYTDLRKQSAEFIASKGADGNAIGGLAVGEPVDKMYEMIEELPDYIVECLDEFISHYGTLEEVVEHKDDIYYYPDCETMTDVAYYYIDELQALGDIPPSLQNYIDYEAYGRDLDMGGCFIETSRGMCEIPY